MIIAIETATEVCSAALIDRDTVLCERSLHEKNIHSERLMLLIDEVLTYSKTSKMQLHGIAVSFGPGSFTGLRIGLSTAKGLAMALDLPLFAVPTLDGIAESFRLNQNPGSKKIFCAMVDAKREEAFFAYYTITQNEIARRNDYSIKLKSEILLDASGQDAVVIQPNISAASIGLLAYRKRNEYTVSDFSHTEPMYLRDFVVTFPKSKV